MGNRSEEMRGAIDASMETEVGEGHLTSRYVHEAVGVPDDEAVVKAIDAWANVWGDEIVPTMKDEGLYDEGEPAHVAAMEKLQVAVDHVKEVLPSAKFMIGYVSFDGGRVQLST